MLFDHNQTAVQNLRENARTFREWAEKEVEVAKDLSDRVKDKIANARKYEAQAIAYMQAADKLEGKV